MSSCNCTNPAREDYEEYANYNLTEPSGDTSDESSDHSVVLNTSYRKVTPLFRAIERENWEGVLLFLNTGKWTSTMFSSISENMRSPSPSLQVKTWVTSYDRKGDPEWSQLPLHAAISYAAPFVVIQKLAEMYPKAIQCTDNEGMLPVHLAFGFGAPDNVLALLLEPFPAAVNEKGLGGRYPYECCELGPNKIRGKVYKTVTDMVAQRVRAEIDRDWKEFAVAAKKSVGLEMPLEVENRKLSDFLLELMKDRKELYEIKHSNRSIAAPQQGSASQRKSPTHRSPGKSFHKEDDNRSRKGLAVMASSSPNKEDSKSKKGRGWGKKYAL